MGPGIGAGGLNWSKGRSVVLDGTDDDEADETALHETLIRPAGPQAVKLAHQAIVLVCFTSAPLSISAIA